MKLKCPSQDPFHALRPLEFTCPNCGKLSSILSDELANRHHHCPECGKRLVEAAFRQNDAYSAVIQFAKSLGVSDVRLMAAEEIVTEDHFRTFCEKPECRNFNKTIHCPPHSLLPAQFRSLVGEYVYALVFKFDLPQVINNEERQETGFLLHDTTVSIEEYAIAQGFKRARGNSAGSCLRTYCREYETCVALEDESACRFPDKARSSLSGLGVNFNELTKHLGWRMSKDLNGPIMLTGIVLLD